ncbi:MAG: helix-turn-helix transcriptional regulator [Microthrixaceae bacterium]
MLNHTTLGGRLRRLRLDRGMSQVQLGKAAGIDNSTVSLIEAGERQGHPATIKALADALDCTVADLITEEAP